MLIDTHCHLTSAGLVERLDEVLANARDAGVGRMILVAMNLPDALAALELLGKHANLYLVAGVHPHEAGQCSTQDFEEIGKLLAGEGVAADVYRRIVGVGETGLDFHYDFAPPARQEEVFRAHLALAERLGLPVVIHARQSEVDVCRILAEKPDVARRTVFHCFSAPVEVAEQVIDLGCYVSFTGVVTFKKAEEIQQSAQKVPAERILLETDAPYLSPEPVRKIRPNEPALMVHTARFLAELRGEEFEAFARATTANAERFFNLPEG
jgi:TatD DNase family protein